MLVQCPSCHTTYRVSDKLIAIPNPTFRCSRCKHIFVLELKPEISRVPKTATPTAPALEQDDEEGRELSLPFAPPHKHEKEAAKEIRKEISDFQKPEQPLIAENEDQTPPAPPRSETDESFRLPREAYDPGKVEEQPPSATEKKQLLSRTTEDQPLPVATERDDRWIITSARPPQDEPFTIPEGDQSPWKEISREPDPTLEKDWRNAPPPLEKGETTRVSGPHEDRAASTAPYLGLFAALLLLYALLVLTHQARPLTVEGFIKAVPWLGPSVLKNDHLRKGISLQSLRSGFEKIRGNREVFVISGVAANRNPISVREVQIEGYVYNTEGEEIERQIISIGNALSSKIIKDLEAKEISILQELKPQKRFGISPQESAAFVIVFLKPTREIKNFSCRVRSAEGGA